MHDPLSLLRAGSARIKPFLGKKLDNKFLGFTDISRNWNTSNQPVLKLLLGRLAELRILARIYHHRFEHPVCIA